MKSKILVHGKSQSRTALGIINAYLKLHPDATPSDVQQAFPKSLNNRCPADNLIVPVTETVGHEKVFFEHEDELVVFKNGEKYALVEVWMKDDFNAICKQAKQYGIQTAKEGTKPFEKGSFELEYPYEGKCCKKCCCKWWWLLLLLLLLLLLIFCCKKCCCGDKCSNPDGTTVENVVVAQPDTADAASGNDNEQPADSTHNPISDNGASLSITLPDGNVLEIPKESPEFQLFSSLNSPDAQGDQRITLDKARFGKGKANLTAGSEPQLKNIAGIMQLFPNLHIKIGGYTDNTGNDDINMRISAERAKVAAEKLVALGADASRITYEGYGSQRPVCPANDTDECRAENRRVDVIINYHHLLQK